MKKIISLILVLSLLSVNLFSQEVDLFSEVDAVELTATEAEETDGEFAAVAVAGLATPAAPAIIAGACVVATGVLAYKVGKVIVHKAKNSKVPKSQVGPSGKAKVHKKKHPTRKKAKDAARNEGTTKPINHKSPARGNRHYHSNKNGVKGRTHHEY